MAVSFCTKTKQDTDVVKSERSSQVNGPIKRITISRPLSVRLRRYLAQARRQEKCWLDLPAWWWQRSIVVRNSKSRRLLGDTAPKLARCWIVRTITIKLEYFPSPSLKYFLSLWLKYFLSPWPPVSSSFYCKSHSSPRQSKDCGGAQIMFSNLGLT